MRNLAACISLLMIMGCQPIIENDAIPIYNQLPEHKRLALVPDDFRNQLIDKKIIAFNQIDSIQKAEGVTFSEEEFHTRVRELGVQYIIVSSSMIEDGCKYFPWITNKNFKVCPGDPDRRYERYYTLLVWDNTTESYHFFRFLYPTVHD